MPDTASNFYALLDVDPQCSFAVLKNAYYRRAKTCHPDLFQGSAAKEEEFKRLVNAFDVLSDPLRRREYDRSLEMADALRAGGMGGDAKIKTPYPQKGATVLDTVADDILEEMIVGNSIPLGASLQTLMRDLENTSRFLRFREAKNYFYRGQFARAEKLLVQAVRESPDNILYHFYLADSYLYLRRYWRARRQYQICLEIGARRTPPQRLLRVQRHLQKLHQRKGVLGRIFSWFSPSVPPLSCSTEEQMVQELSQSMGKLIRDRYGKDQKRRPLTTPLLEDRKKK